MIIVPNGGAPEKLNYFSKRSDCILIDNGGDNSNKKLFINMYKFNEHDKILITSEEQLELLSRSIFSRSNKNKFINKCILSRCIYLKSELSNDPAFLCNKGVITKLPNLGKGTKLVDKSKLSKYKNNPNYIIKETNSSGSRGVHLYKSLGNIDINDKFDKDQYLIQPMCGIEDYHQYTIPVIIRDGKLKHFIPILGSKETYCCSKWRSLHINGSHNKYLLSGISEIIDTLKLVDGFAEFEIFVNKLNPNIMMLIDINPRWSYDNSTCSRIVQISGLDRYYDHLDGYLNNTEFFVPNDFIGQKLRLSEEYVLCKNFSHI